jgi:hypothetical protein
MVGLRSNIIWTRYRVYAIIILVEFGCPLLMKYITVTS